jgi:hypothetical protein
VSCIQQAIVWDIVLHYRTDAAQEQHTPGIHSRQMPGVWVVVLFLAKWQGATRLAAMSTTDRHNNGLRGTGCLKQG